MSTSALARRFRVDVSADGTTWLQLKGMTDFNPQVDVNSEDSTTYDNDGWESSERTMLGWSVEATVLRQADGGVFDPAQELCRLRQDQFGDAARIHVRWYDKTGAPEAYEGVAQVDWNRSKSGVKDLDEAKVTFKGDGAREAIANPYAAAAAPALVSASPSGAAQGAQVTITGQGFAGVTGAAGVKFGATNASSYVVVSDSVIVAVVPAGSAGAANITVTNAAGTSAPLDYTRGA
jgi:hypothetical protein